MIIKLQRIKDGISVIKYQLAWHCNQFRECKNEYYKLQAMAYCHSLFLLGVISESVANRIYASLA
jgi:hypothetical protein